MASKKNYALLLAWLISLVGLIGNSSATHISQPVVENPKTHYAIGEPIVLHGWVDYNGQPAPDVLLNFKLTRPNGNVAVEQFYSSDSNGRFDFKFDTKNEESGDYQLTITSHCLEIHRYACTYKYQTLPIQLKNP